MRKILLGLLLLILIISPLYAGGNRWTNKPPVGSQIDWSHPLAKGLVGCWLMNEGGGNIVKNIVDSNNGTIVGGGNWIATQRGITINFDGNDDYINIPNKASLNPSNISIVISYFNQSVDTNQRWLVMKAYTSHIDPYYQYGLRDRTSSSEGVGFSLTINGVLTGTGTNKFLPPLATWVNIVGTYDGSNIKLFGNGILKDTVASSGTINAYNTDLALGININVGATTAFKGKIAYCYIYSRALSPSEIQQLYQDPYCFIKPLTIWSMFSTAVAAARRMWMFE